MKKIMLFAVMMLTGFVFLAATASAVRKAEENRKGPVTGLNPMTNIHYTAREE
ncbi:MAG: hypothetical protein ACKVQW_16520 [Pyrinomonadaceae bacterium]